MFNPQNSLETPQDAFKTPRDCLEESRGPRTSWRLAQYSVETQASRPSLERVSVMYALFNSSFATSIMRLIDYLLCCSILLFYNSRSFFVRTIVIPVHNDSYMIQHVGKTSLPTQQSGRKRDVLLIIRLLSSREWSARFSFCPVSFCIPCRTLSPAVARRDSSASS